jgi:hypothetical protein
VPYGTISGSTSTPLHLLHFLEELINTSNFLLFITPFKLMHSGEKSLFLDKILIEKIQIMEIFLSELKTEVSSFEIYDYEIPP